MGKKKYPIPLPGAAKSYGREEGSRVSLAKPEEVREHEDQQLIDKVKASSKRTPMVNLINCLYDEAHNKEGMSLASQRYITTLLRNAARFADDPADREARNNPLARVLKLSGKQDRKWLEYSTAVMLHMYIREMEGKRGAMAYAINKLRDEYPEINDIYSDIGTFRRVYKKFSPDQLDKTYLEEITRDYFSNVICSK